ncbi:MAG: exodeoxyribonuclease VII large subunit [Gemmatimonadales bacterium]
MDGLNLFPPGGTASTEEIEADAAGAWTVSDVTARARRLIESGFTRIWVKGEVSGFKSYRSGHWYFSLRDSQAQVRCVMWRSDNERLRITPEDGVEVYVRAQPTVWEERGEFRLTVRELLPTDAEGLWQLKFERAKAALAKDGLLDPSRKRRLPEFPRRIAVVTSIDGAALTDIVTVIGRRWPAVELWVVPSRVQGEGAERELCRALELVNRLPEIDVAIVGRGGGSREDLWTFNLESVARAIAAVSVPTVSAVGHETDVTLADLVADYRAATPSAAAEAVVPDRQAVSHTLAAVARRLAKGLSRRTDLAAERMERTGDRLATAISARLERDERRLAELGAKLDALSPLRVLERGYAVARDEEGRVLKRVDQFGSGMPFRLTVTDGQVRAKVTGEQ